MKASHEPLPDRSSSFRMKLMAAIMLVVSCLTAVGLYFAQRNVAAETEYDQRVEFQGALASLHGAQEVRSAALAQRCRGLANSVRIRAALAESDVRDLYENAAIELRDVLESGTRVRWGRPELGAREFLSASRMRKVRCSRHRAQMGR
jgi:hypothetical protein